MAVVAISDSILTDIADAIRSKNGQETLYKPSDMPDAIEAISGGSSTPVINSLSVTENGTYTAPTGVDGYSPITVNVPSSSPSLGTKSITENGTYNASSDSLDGYSSVTVNVPQGSTPTGTKQISITQNGTTTEDVTNYANAEISVNVSGGSSDPVKYTRYNLTSDMTIKQFLDSINYQVQEAMCLVIIIRTSGTVAPSSGSYTMNNYIFYFYDNNLGKGRHYYQRGLQTPDSFSNLPSQNEDDNTASISNGILESSYNGTSCLGASGDVVTIAEVPISVDNTKMNGGVL